MRKIKMTHMHVQIYIQIHISPCKILMYPKKIYFRSYINDFSKHKMPFKVVHSPCLEFSYTSSKTCVTFTRTPFGTIPHTRTALHLPASSPPPISPALKYTSLFSLALTSAHKLSEKSHNIKCNIPVATRKRVKSYKYD